MSGPGADVAALVRMVNQIAANVAHHPHDQAVTEIAAHLRLFWPLSMRAGLVGYLDGGGVGLTPLALEATERLRPPAVTPAASAR